MTERPRRSDGTADDAEPVSFGDDRTPAPDAGPEPGDESTSVPDPGGPSDPTQATSRRLDASFGPAGAAGGTGRGARGGGHRRSTRTERLRSTAPSSVPELRRSHRRRAGVGVRVDRHRGVLEHPDDRRPGPEGQLGRHRLRRQFAGHRRAERRRRQRRRWFHRTYQAENFLLVGSDTRVRREQHRRFRGRARRRRQHRLDHAAARLGGPAAHLCGVDAARHVGAQRRVQQLRPEHEHLRRTLGRQRRTRRCTSTPSTAPAARSAWSTPWRT